MNAKFVKKLDGFRGDARLYSLSKPLSGFPHVVVSAVGSAFDTGMSETYIFGASSEGEVLEWGELPGSARGEFDHHAALNRAGYEVE
jgi:hypothetical protein